MEVSYKRGNRPHIHTRKRICINCILLTEGEFSTKC